MIFIIYLTNHHFTSTIPVNYLSVDALNYNDNCMIVIINTAPASKSLKTTAQRIANFRNDSKLIYTKCG